jgi:hypothetical protein
MRRRIVVSAALVAALAQGSGVRAQEDFRAADLDRPTKVEDANPIELRAWEIEVGSRASAREGSRRVETVVELKAGLLRNTQFGVELTPVLERVGSGGGTEAGLEAASAHLFYGLRRETVSGPALALRIDASTPGTGVVGHADPQLGFKGVASRSLGRLRLHGNGGYVVATDADGGDYWRGGLGGDYPWGLFSRALLADVYAEIPTSGTRARVWTELGMRIQISNVSVLDVGLATRLDEWEAGDPNVELVLGLARVFGFGVSVDDHPNPSIR